ncbi:MAG: hypothetical protein BWY73_00919 [candidate division TA06 bacterium ADurb.Bin417]|uniref:Uncharacterized protein n=1 Tax=candidate division TA06 bacterium ADurb.Bin417 TaxID=1852828 RepID=A0A1V5MGV3_UNCT6|nr:MAG: hypothetical protein BWY73_00919 [candidate division TA06 bacterium ADurb.Bin417]
MDLQAVLTGNYPFVIHPEGEGQPVLVPATVQVDLEIAAVVVGDEPAALDHLVVAARLDMTAGPAPEGKDAVPGRQGIVLPEFAVQNQVLRRRVSIQEPETRSLVRLVPDRTIRRQVQQAGIGGRAVRVEFEDDAPAVLDTGEGEEGGRRHLEGLVGGPERLEEVAGRGRIGALDVNRLFTQGHCQSRTRCARRRCGRRHQHRIAEPVEEAHPAGRIINLQVVGAIGQRRGQAVPVQEAHQHHPLAVQH